MVKCVCGKQFENKAGLSSHKKWCDEKVQYKECPVCGKSVPEIYFQRHKNSKKCKQNRGKIAVNTSELCDYGCGQEAKYEMSSGKLCCSKRYQSCPEVCRKNSESVSEVIDPEEMSRRGEKGGGWNKGMTFEEAFGKEKAEQMKRASVKNRKRPGKADTKEAEAERRRKLSQRLKEHPNGGGCRKGSGIGKGCWYQSDIAGHVWLDSTYELAYVRYLDAEGIKWRRNTCGFTYSYEGERHEYIPDFHLPNKETYVEVKGFKTEKDDRKWKQFPHDLDVLFKEDLEQLGCDI